MITLWRAGDEPPGVTSWTSSRVQAEQYASRHYGPSFGGVDVHSTEVGASERVLDLRSDLRGGLAALGLDLDDYDHDVERIHDLMRDLVPVFIAHGFTWVAFVDAGEAADEWLRLRTD